MPDARRRRIRQFERASLIAIALLPACSTQFAEPSDRRPTQAPLPATLSPLPPEVAINKGARPVGSVLVSVRLAGGPEFECFIDTGSPSSLLPKSAEPLLGSAWLPAPSPPSIR
jgi:hypothetical protein